MAATPFRNSSGNVYNSHWKTITLWANNKGFLRSDISYVTLAEYLVYLFSQHKKMNAIQVHKASISSVLKILNPTALQEETPGTPGQDPSGGRTDGFPVIWCPISSSLATSINVVLTSINGRWEHSNSIMVYFLIGHYTYKMFPPAIPTPPQASDYISGSLVWPSESGILTRLVTWWRLFNFQSLCTFR